MLAVLLLIQVVGNVPGKAVVDDPRARTPVTCVGDSDGVPGSWIPSGSALSHCRHLGSEWKISVSPCL